MSKDCKKTSCYCHGYQHRSDIEFRRMTRHVFKYEDFKRIYRLIHGVRGDTST